MSGLPTEQEGHTLARGLSNRHLQLIAIGGAIGTGLFMGSGKTISVAGPSVILVYAVIGFFLYFMMRAMGELLLSNLNYRSFTDLATDLVGPWAGFMVGWSYWFCWIVTGVADVVAVAGYLKQLQEYEGWSTTPLWIPGLVMIVLLLVLNLVAVRLFGELEFWFSMIKIIAILALVLTAAWLLVSQKELVGGGTASLGHMFNDGGFFPTGGQGFLAGFQIAVFAFVGLELVGTAAAETKDPRKNLPKAINSIPLRILFFYVLGLVSIMTIIPWRQAVAGESPFIAAFGLVGFSGAFVGVTLVVMSSATSSANSGMYSTARMLFGLADQGAAPRLFSVLSSNKVPARALLVSCSILLLGIPLLYASPSIGAAFDVVTTVSSVLFMFVWSMILFSYMAYRKRFPERHAESKFKMLGGVPMCYAVLAFFLFLVVIFTFKEDTRTGLLATIPWFVVLVVGYFAIAKNPRHLAHVEEHRQMMARPIDENL
ncbi:amino acid permease [Micrococcales bacterium 31B]|nr:amino acid permease [Micrococcales bacterium 31B]